MYEIQKKCMKKIMLWEMWLVQILGLMLFW